MRWTIATSRVEGAIEVPGDKSIGHRALMLAGLAEGISEITNLPSGEDVRSTVACMQALGAHIETVGDRVVVRSSGRLTAPASPLDAGNSGTTTRLLAGILAGQRFQSCLTGDASLRRRPMRRVVDPLGRMGARIETDDGRAPLDIIGSQLTGIRYELPIPSAQIKSCILLAALAASGMTEVVEPVRSRDHTERMFGALGIRLEREGDVVRVEGGQRPGAFQLRVPGDPSSAAFFFAAAALTGGRVTVLAVSTNPTRSGFLEVLQRMGASVELSAEREVAGEPVGDVSVTGSGLVPVAVEADEVPLLVDEIPLIALLATQAAGVSSIRGAAELRHKESDRISAVAQSLTALGADIQEQPDGFVVHGPTPLRGASVPSDGDHRLAMMLAVAGCIASGETVIEEAEAAAVSYPEFSRDFIRLGARVACE